MSTETLFNLSFSHWQAFLLSFIPALGTLGSAVYIYSKFPAYKMTRVYLLFLGSMCVYQLNDSMHRLSGSEDTARAWDRLLVLLWVIIAPTALHWSLLLVGNKKLGNSLRFLVPLYFSALFLAIPLIAGLYSQPFSYSSFWGWMVCIKTPALFLLSRSDGGA
jgi:hypothetical protein